MYNSLASLYSRFLYLSGCSGCNFYFCYETELYDSFFFFIYVGCFCSFIENMVITYKIYLVLKLESFDYMSYSF